MLRCIILIETKYIRCFLIAYDFSSVLTCGFDKSVYDLGRQMRCWKCPVSSFHDSIQSVPLQKVNHLFGGEIVE